MPISGHHPTKGYVRHEHAVLASENSETGRSVPLSNSGGGWSVNRITDQGYPIGGATGNTDPAGVPGGPLSTSVKDWLDHMQVWIDGVDRTSAILDLANGNWDPDRGELGDGTDSHPLVVEGTGLMDITSLVSYAGPGAEQHVIEFKVPNGGGRIRYDLYVTQ